MKLFYFPASIGNFGDDLNAWLWPRLFPDAFSDDEEALFIGIGTILDERIPNQAKRKVVFGSGVRKIAGHPTLDHTWDIRFVRGPISAHALGCPEKYITDGAVCLRLLDLPPSEATSSTLFIPHFHTVRDHPYILRSAPEGVRVIDPRDEVESVIAAVRGAKAVITESLHGAILADLYRVPWTRLRLYSWKTEKQDVSSLKWMDWGLSVGVDAAAWGGTSLPIIRGRIKRSVTLPVYSIVARRKVKRLLSSCLRASPFKLSNDAICSSRIQQAADAVDAFRRDYLR